MRLLLGFLLLLSDWSPSVAGPDDDLTLANGRVLNVLNGQISEPTAIRVRDGQIAAIGPMAVSARTVDCGGRFVVPGLWDMHVHLRTELDAELLLLNGVTAARVMAGSPRWLKFRDRILDGDALGPRLYVASPAIGDYPLHMYSPEYRCVDSRTTDDAIREMLRSFRSAGYDGFKLHEFQSEVTFRRVADAALEERVPTWGHVSGDPVHPLPACMRTIEHLEPWLRAGGFPFEITVIRRQGESALDKLRREDIRSLARAYAKRGIAFVPTLSAYPPLGQLFIERAAESPYLTRFHRAWWKNYAAERARWPEDPTAILEAARLIIPVAAEEGVPVLCGTDAGIPGTVVGESVHGELQRLRNAGLGTLDVIRACTDRPARALGIKSGVVSAGFAADLLVLDTNPIESLDALQRPWAIVVRGDVMTRAELDERAKALRAKYENFDVWVNERKVGSGRQRRFYRFLVSGELVGECYLESGDDVDEVFEATTMVVVPFPQRESWSLSCPKDGSVSSLSIEGGTETQYYTTILTRKGASTHVPSTHVHGKLRGEVPSLQTIARVGFHPLLWAAALWRRGVATASEPDGAYLVFGLGELICIKCAIEVERAGGTLSCRIKYREGDPGELRADFADDGWPMRVREGLVGGISYVWERVE